MKLLKMIGKTIKWILIVAVVLILTSPLWIGFVVTTAANSVVPGIVKTDFAMNKFGLNMYTGKLTVGDLKLANPTNYSAENCVELNDLSVNLAMTSLCSKKIRIEEIVVDGLYIATTAGGGNFMQIAENASAGGEEMEEAVETAEATPEEVKAEEAEEGKEGGGVQIDRLVLRNLKIKYGVVPVPLPEMTFEGIGADKEEGASWAETWNEVCTAVMKKATDIGGAIGDAASAAGETLGNAASALTETLGNAASGVSTESLGNAASATGEALGNAASATGEALGNAASAAGEAAGAAVDSIKNLFK